MTNGFEINITEKDFKSKDQAEQNWILFQGVSSVSKCVTDIDTSGCEFARKRRRVDTLRLATAISAGVVSAVGFIYILLYIIHI